MTVAVMEDVSMSTDNLTRLLAGVVLADDGEDDRIGRQYPALSSILSLAWRTSDFNGRSGKLASSKRVDLVIMGPSFVSDVICVGNPVENEYLWWILLLLLLHARIGLVGMSSCSGCPWTVPEVSKPITTTTTTTTNTKVLLLSKTTDKGSGSKILSNET
jgi:hypothetical protein